MERPSNLPQLTLKSPEARRYFTQLCVEWRFNLERAPWWGGFFERMVKSAKRCLKKVIGRNCLTYDELLTLVIKVEAVLNSRPLTYISSEDVEEPLTPSHLLVGYRIMTLPDPSIPEDPDSTDVKTSHAGWTTSLGCFRNSGSSGRRNTCWS